LSHSIDRHDLELELTTLRLRRKAGRGKKQLVKNNERELEELQISRQAHNLHSRDGEGARNRRTSKLPYHGKVRLPGWMEAHPCSWGHNLAHPNPPGQALDIPARRHGKPITWGESPRQPQARPTLAGDAARHHESSQHAHRGEASEASSRRSSAGATCCPGPRKLLSLTGHDAWQRGVGE